MKTYLIKYKSHTFVEANDKKEVEEMCKDFEFDEYEIIEED